MKTTTSLVAWNFLGQPILGEVAVEEEEKEAISPEELRRKYGIYYFHLHDDVTTQLEGTLAVMVLPRSNPDSDVLLGVTGVFRHSQQNASRKEGRIRAYQRLMTADDKVVVMSLDSFRSSLALPYGLIDLQVKVLPKTVPLKMPFRPIPMSSTVGFAYRVTDFADALGAVK